MEARPLKRVDLLRHELKALRFILDHYHAGQLDSASLPPRDDFQSDQGRQIYAVILEAPNQAAAEGRIRELELDEVDIESFLRLSGEHYHSYPALVHQRAEAIRRGQLRVEAA
jgi:hypothetical protein